MLYMNAAFLLLGAASNSTLMEKVYLLEGPWI